MPGVPNPATGPAATLPEQIGVQTYTTPGTFTVTPPAGATFVKLTMRGGAGSSGSNSQSSGATNGGAGALQRRLVSIGSGSFSVTVGNGGSATGPPGNQPGSDGQASTALGFTADYGRVGSDNVNGPIGAGGTGTDGPEPLVGLGYFNGAAGRGGVAPFARAEYSGPGAGDPGYVYLEFYR